MSAMKPQRKYGWPPAGAALAHAPDGKDFRAWILEDDEECPAELLLPHDAELIPGKHKPLISPWVQRALVVLAETGAHSAVPKGFQGYALSGDKVVFVDLPEAE